MQQDTSNFSRSHVPWRTRGSVAPTMGFPTINGISVNPQEPIRAGDAFVVTDNAQAGDMQGCLGRIPEDGSVSGDLLVANGADPGTWAGWTYVANTDRRVEDPASSIVVGAPSAVFE